MTARGRGLAILTGLAVFVAGWVMFVSRWSGPAGAGPHGRAEVAGARAAKLDAFRNELVVWAPGGFSEREVGRVRDSTRVAAISAVRTGTLAAASGRHTYRVVPLETMAVDTNAYTSATGRPGRKLATLLPKGAVLSKTGAKLRRVKSGGKLKLDGNRTLRVSGVVGQTITTRSTSFPVRSITSYSGPDAGLGDMMRTHSLPSASARTDPLENAGR